MRSRLLTFAALASGAGVVVSLLVACLADPRKDDAVTTVDKCDLQALSTDPANPQSSLRAYVEATDTLAKRANDVDTGMRDVCNAINQDLGIAAGTDSVSACKGLTARIEGVIKKQPPLPPGALANTDWVEIHIPASCKPPPGTLEGCLAKCAGPCDPTKCAPDKIAGKCNGTCLGTCSESGDAVPCTGSCVGETTLDGGSCAGECIGRCGAQAWAGQCSASCPAGFTGSCAGTCTGACDGVPIGDAGAPMDAGGMDAGGMDAGDAGEGGMGMPEGGPPPGPPSFKPPPGGADGNCQGKCVGLCSSGANGDCKAPCLTFADGGPPIGTFTAGFCGALGTPAACTGACRSANGNGTITACNGTCTQVGQATCNGVCRVKRDAGGCMGTLENPFCEGSETCAQNAECNNACSAATALAAVCTEPKVIQIFSVSDPVLFAALEKHGGALGKVVNELSQLRNAFSFVGNRAFGDFNSIGLSGDLVRACVTQGEDNAKVANVKIVAVVAANPTTRKLQ